MRRLVLPRHGRRGTLLAAYVIMIPLVLGLFAAVLTRLETLLADTKRWQMRTQARLLAESALAVYQATQAEAPDSASNSPALEGAIDSVGAYRVFEGKANALGRTIRAQGEVVDRRRPRLACRVVSEIEAQVRPPSPEMEIPALRMLGVSYRVTSFDASLD